MNCRIACFFIFTAFHVIRLAAQSPIWSQLPGSPTSLLLNGNTPRDDDNHFVDPLHGWVARATDGIYRTTNGGLTFQKVYSSTNAFPGINLVAHFRSINFASATRGWAGNLGPGSYDNSVTDTNMLYETFDGGNSWNPVPAINNSGMKGFCAIHVMDSQHIYGAGRVRGPAFFAKSENGGATWSVTNLTLGGAMGGLMDVYFKDATNGFVVGMDTNAFNSCSAPFYHGAIARTTNGGLSWNVVANTPVNCSYFWKMSWPSANVGYASLQQNASENTIIFFKTIDGGATWTSNGIPHASIGVSSGTTWFLQGIGFRSETEGWIGGSTSTALTFNQCFIHTTDGGITWSPVGYNNTRGMNRIRFLSPTFGFGSGQRVHVYRVPLFITTQPTNQTVVAGANAVFNVIAQGATQLTYQWRFNITNAVGESTNVFTIGNVQSIDTGKYDVVVSDYSGSITSSVATLALDGEPVAPTIIAQPQSQIVNLGSNATFTVAVSGTAPFIYQWRFNSGDIPAATNSIYSRMNVQPADLGNYSVVVTNVAGAATSAVAILSFPFTDIFDDYVSPSIVTNTGTTNGYKIFFNAASGATDFKAIFGFDYSTVTYPTNIPPAPHSTNGTTRGLFLTVNKDANGQLSAVNLYPIDQFASGNFALKFDLWINWADPATSTEHALFGINHSGNVTNRVGLNTSDGLFFAVDGEGGSTATSTTLRDFSVFRGGGGDVIPVLLTTNNTIFGPTPVFAPQFDSSNPSLAGVFPGKTIPGYGSTSNGTAGLGWINAEVRQVNSLITWLLKGTVIAQYTNTYGYTNGTLMLGYNDNFNSIGDSNNFAIFDNVRVEPIILTSVQLLAPQIFGNNFKFSFATEAFESYTVQSATNLTSPAWVNWTNFAGNGATNDILIPVTGAPQYFRVRRP
jgi:photosystem II stability/assembly factor-like uncharacterized protein